jgi:hypothetical protein
MLAIETDLLRSLLARQFSAAKRSVICWVLFLANEASVFHSGASMAVAGFFLASS